MAQQHIGQAGPPLPLQPPQGVHVPGHQIPAVLGGEEAVFPVCHCGPVAQVVLAAHHIAPPGEKFRHVGITAHMLGNAVDDLDHPTGRSLRRPLHRLNGLPPIGGGIGQRAALGHRYASFLCETPQSPAETTLSAQCAHWAPPPQGEARERGTDCHVGLPGLLAMTRLKLGSPCGGAGAASAVTERAVGHRPS